MIENNRDWAILIAAGTGVAVLVTGQVWLYTRAGGSPGNIGTVPPWFKLFQLGALVLIVLAIVDLARKISLERVFQK